MDSMLPICHRWRLLFGHETEMAHADPGAGIDEVPKRLMPNDLPLQLFGFDLGAHHEMLHQGIDGGSDDHDIGAAQSRARRGAAQRFGTEIELAGN